MKEKEQLILFHTNNIIKEITGMQNHNKLDSSRASDDYVLNEANGIKKLLGEKPVENEDDLCDYDCKECDCC